MVEFSSCISYVRKLSQSLQNIIYQMSHEYRFFSSFFLLLVVTAVGLSNSNLFQDIEYGNRAYHSCIYNR